jgi:hypothetical protein
MPAPRPGRDGVRQECDLYEPVKAFLEIQGYEVKGEVAGCDVVAIRGTEAPVIVELKRAFNLALVLQGVDRLSLTDFVYLAVQRPGRRRQSVGVSVYRAEVRRLCRRLGLGLMTVAPEPAGVEVLLDPLPCRPRRSARRLARLLGEHSRRAGDPNRGGASRTPIVTAYRQEALRCALLLQDAPHRSLKALRETGLVPNAPRILQRDVYRWFERVARATYRLTERAREDVTRFAAAGRLPSLTIGPARSSGPRRRPPRGAITGPTCACARRDAETWPA